MKGKRCRTLLPDVDGAGAGLEVVGAVEHHTVGGEALDGEAVPALPLGAGDPETDGGDAVADREVADDEQVVVAQCAPVEPDVAPDLLARHDPLAVDVEPDDGLLLQDCSGHPLPFL